MASTLSSGRAGCTLQVGPYQEVKKTWPVHGRHVLAQYDEDTVVVYQAYNREIGHYAAEHKKFVGCKHFSESRMTWIKTNFLWMQFRSDWGSKHNQEVTLAIWLKRSAFEEILKLAMEAKKVLQDETPQEVGSRKKKGKKGKRQGNNTEVNYEEIAEETAQEVERLQVVEEISDDNELPTKQRKERPRLVRLQWDPDHTPSGNKVPFRRAIQLGLRGVREFIDGTWIVDIQNITPFVREQSAYTTSLKELQVPWERVYVPSDTTIATRIRLDKEDSRTEGNEVDLYVADSVNDESEG